MRAVASYRDLAIRQWVFVDRQPDARVAADVGEERRRPAGSEHEIVLLPDEPDRHDAREPVVVDGRQTEQVTGLVEERIDLGGGQLRHQKSSQYESRLRISSADSSRITRPDRMT